MRRINVECALFWLSLSMACGTKPSTGDAGNVAYNVTGTWTGSVSSAGAISVGARFTLEDQNARLSGRTYFEDSRLGEFVEDADLSGSRDGLDASWTTSTDLIVVGRFDANSFVGTIRFPPDDELGPHVANLTLNR